MRLLGIEGGGTRTSALLVEGTDTVLASFAVGPGNLKLLNGERPLERLNVRLHAKMLDDCHVRLINRRFSVLILP